MPKEIERKFLVTGPGWRKHADGGKKIRQAYLAHTRDVSIRVRTIGKNKAFLTIKSAKAELSRDEYEYEIPVHDARKLMKLRTGRLIVKRRYIVEVARSRFEVDVFARKLKGLVIAEIELTSRHTLFKRPDWLGKEITGKKRYYNSQLARA
jgi:CYTH domain-containing protein